MPLNLIFLLLRDSPLFKVLQSSLTPLALADRRELRSSYDGSVDGNSSSTSTLLLITRFPPFLAILSGPPIFAPCSSQLSVGYAEEVAMLPECHCETASFVSASD